MIPARPMQPGRKAHLRDALAGQIFSGERSGRWRHPWNTRLTWQARTGQWVAQIQPGFVSGRAPMVRVTVPTQQDAAQDFGINPLTGRPFFSDDVFRQQEIAGPSSQRLDIPLYLQPMIPLRWRAAGYDGDPSAPVPQFFLDRGVIRARKQPSLDDIGAPTSLEANEPPTGMRLLRACDLILHQPREALTSQIETKPGLATGDSIVTQTLGLQSPPSGDDLQVIVGTFRPPNAGINPLQGDYVEPTWDELLIATCYLLSPPDTVPGSEPDGTWQPFVRHELFWNLTYAQPRLRWFDTDADVPFIPPLAGGAAQLVVNFLTASINDMLQQTLNLITGESRAGAFWTDSCGGSTAEAPEEPTTQPQGSTGLNKAGRLDAKAAEEAKRRRQERLDPPFPFRARSFEPGTLLR